MLEKFNTAEKMIVGLNHEYLEKKYSGIKTAGDAYDTGYVTLAEIDELYGENKASLLIESWIVQIVLFFTLPLDKNQIRELAYLLYDDNKILNIAELSLFFTRVKKGYYGTFYGRFDPAEFTSWMRYYRKERGKYVSTLPDTYESKILKEARETFEKEKNSKNLKK